LSLATTASRVGSIAFLESLIGNGRVARLRAYAKSLAAAADNDDDSR
jgi:hypothetical protein